MYSLVAMLEQSNAMQHDEVVTKQTNGIVTKLPKPKIFQTKWDEGFYVNISCLVSASGNLSE